MLIRTNSKGNGFNPSLTLPREGMLIRTNSKGNGFSPSLTLPREGMLIRTNSKGNGFNSLASAASDNFFNSFNF